MPSPAIIGQYNREAVRKFFLTHVGCTNVECAAVLGISVMAVGRHIKTIRREWDVCELTPTTGITGGEDWTANALQRPDAVATLPLPAAQAYVQSLNRTFPKVSLRCQTLPTLSSRPL